MKCNYFLKKLFSPVPNLRICCDFLAAITLRASNFITMYISQVGKIIKGCKLLGFIDGIPASRFHWLIR